MKRNGLALALVLATAALTLLAPSASADAGADGSRFVLTSFDGTTLSGLNKQGTTFTASFAAATSFKPAALDKYYPGDPCRSAAAVYNLAISGQSVDVSVSAAVSTMAAEGCVAKVLLETSSQIIPPNPVKQFQPAAAGS